MAVSSERDDISDFAGRDAVVKSRAVAEMLSVTRLHTETDLSLLPLSNGSGILDTTQGGATALPGAYSQGGLSHETQTSKAMRGEKCFRTICGHMYAWKCVTIRLGVDRS